MMVLTDKEDTGLRVVRTNTLAAGRCPLRGLRWDNKQAIVPPLLDERCPTYMEAIGTESEAPGQQTLGMLVPVVRRDSYCRQCLDKRIRENELA